MDVAARQLGVSVSYLSQIEANQRPLTTRVLLALVSIFEQPASFFDVDEEQRLAADLRDALAEAPGGSSLRVSAGEVQRAALQAPTLARRYLELFRAYQRLDERLRLTEEAVALDEASSASSLLPYEEVRDFFHYKDNYIDTLDRAAETLASELGLPAGGRVDQVLIDHLADRWGVSVADHADREVLRRYDPLRRELSLHPAQSTATRNFQLAYQVCVMSFAAEIEAELEAARFRSPAARDVCRVGLGNYAAASLLMPYGRFAAEARLRRHDIEQLAMRFQASLEQVAHRLSTLQRPGERGLPFFFVRLDPAGNITKRHSATHMRFARFGGACPLWNVHDALAVPDRFLVQIAEMPDGVRYLSVARSIVKRARSYAALDRRYVISFGCELEHAKALVYADAVDLAGPATPIGVSCRICERPDCAQRAFPPVDRALTVPAHERRLVPFRLV